MLVGLQSALISGIFYVDARVAPVVLVRKFSLVSVWFLSQFLVLVLLTFLYVQTLS